MSLKTFLFGKPLATEEGEGERVGAIAGVPILGLDALASAAYGPEALLTVLLPLGVYGLNYLPQLTLLIILLLCIVFTSYRQTIDAYPSGGGAYTVAKENLGRNASLFAAAALALDYLLNVAVAISAGTGALVSAIPALLPYTLPICLGILTFLTIVNLRGVRATGLAFMVPTYVFVACLFATIAIGIVKAGASPTITPVVPPPTASATMTTASLALLLHAFSSGCTAMTGVEAVSNGVPIFKHPATVGAKRTLALIIGILVVLLAGEALLCKLYQVTATAPGAHGYQSVLSQLVAATTGRGSFYYLTLASVVTLLALSANTSFAGFPRLCSILAHDKFLPEPFVHRGRRLAFSHGIIVLSALAAMLLISFGGITDRLIPLFAVGALSAFTMSQAGMVMHWKRHASAHWKRSLVVNAVGALGTFVTLSIVLVAKFEEGAWLTVLLVVTMIVLFMKIRGHYDFIARATDTNMSLQVGPFKPPIAVVPIRRWDALSLKALRFALGFTSEVTAVQVLTRDRQVDDLSERWPELAEKPLQTLGLKPPELVVLKSQYRELFQPLLEFIKKLSETHADRQIAVVVPELVERRWYYYLLHNNAATLIKAWLLQRGGPQVVVISTPWYLRDWMPERRRLHERRPGLLRSLWTEGSRLPHATHAKPKT